MDLLDVPAWAAGLTKEEVAAHWVEVIIEAAFELDGEFRSSRRSLCLALAAIRKRLTGYTGRSSAIVAPPRAPSEHLMWNPQQRTTERWRSHLRGLVPNVGDVLRLGSVYHGPTLKRVVAAARGWPEFSFYQQRAPGQRYGRPAFFLRRVAPDPVQAAAA